VNNDTGVLKIDEIGYVTSSEPRRRSRHRPSRGLRGRSSVRLLTLPVKRDFGAYTAIRSGKRTLHTFGCVVGKNIAVSGVARPSALTTRRSNQLKPARLYSRDEKNDALDPDRPVKNVFDWVINRRALE
jgi:hypothetical protein